MALIDNENVKYDTEGRYYYLTEAGMIKYTGKEYLKDLWENNAGATALRLKTQGRMLHNKYIESAYNGRELRFRHQDLIEYMVYLNANGEVNAIIQSLTEIVYASEDIDWDKKIRVGQVEWLPMILQPISNVNVYFTGEIIDEVPEAEYRVGY